MKIDLTAISGFLTGSLVTLIIREVINQINKKVDFNREIKRMTYQKKLERAESAVAFYWTYSNKAVEVKKSLETIHKAVTEIDETELDIQIISGVLNQNSNTLAGLAGDKYFDINGIHLYFDLEDSKFWNEDDLGQLYDSIAELKFRDNDVQFWISLHNVHFDKNEELADHYWEEMKKVLPEYLKSLQKFINLIEKNRKATDQLIKTIKNQIKKI
ncbi:MAG: hypothetical protein CMB80_19445 [Flammeovirgaceae bacterium]|nr:hypothetical protein [Flammeovirgaceae bacterium]|tara:strand:- start:3102 stop:3746 length:645 start_codon:yes stop_codon:yes gene_type:complete